MIEPGSPEFPAAKDDDDDDVAWALSTAAVQWKRGSRADAVVWLRRAIDSAVTVGATWRAAELTRQTDRLEAFLVAPPVVSQPLITELDDHDGTDVIDEDALSLPPDADLNDSSAPTALSADATDETTDITAEDLDAAAVEVDEDVEEISDDELSDDEASEGLPRFASEAPTANLERPYFDSSVDELLESEPVSEREPRYEADEDPAPTPVRLSVADAVELDSAPDTESEPEPAPDTQDDLEPAPDTQEDLEPALNTQSESEPAPDTQSAPEPEPEPEPEPRVAGILLSEIAGFEDFPPETQLALARAARVERLATEEEVSNFGLALVLRGSVSVMPAIADVRCGAAGERELVYGRGTLADGVALRLVATAPDTQVAVWDLATIEPPLAECPWVLEELKGVADKYQALAGVSMGPMGERLDDALREMVLSRCSLVRLMPGELLVERGKPVGGLFIVGAGRIELGNDASRPGSEGELGPGEFLFAPQVLAAGAAPTAARAGASGALLMAADRHAAHELMLSVPPLLELLAG
ncbi:MAG TPA: hypothetical protein VIW29_06865 [Polyangiaceae bacterium]